MGECSSKRNTVLRGLLKFHGRRSKESLHKLVP
jgi:hypothetical protein